MPRDEGRLIEGYESPNPSLTLTAHPDGWGVPRLWFILSIMGSIFAAFALFTTFQSWLALVPLACWVVMAISA